MPEVIRGAGIGEDAKEGREITMSEIPLVDLGIQTAQVKAASIEEIGRIADSNAFVLSSVVERFETEYASYLGVADCIGVANGTDALELALRALDIPAGSEVLVPANSFVASALAVLRAGHNVRFVDPSPDRLLVTASEFETRITSATRVIMPVHLYGQLVPMEPILELARKTGAFVIEDAAQSHGARSDGRHAGTWGHLAATSFYPGKNLGAWGDGGAVVTGDHGLGERVRLLRNYGSSVRYHHDEIGFNSRLDSVQAAVLSVKLPLLDGWNAERRALALRYQAAFNEHHEISPVRLNSLEDDALHLYVVAVDHRDDVLKGLHAQGIGAAIHYPIPIPRQKAFMWHADSQTSFPVAEEFAARIISLPMFPGMTESQCDRVIDTLCNLVAE